MRFLIPRRSGLSELVRQCAYLVGSDGAPWASEVRIENDLLVVSRETRESGRLIAPWPIPVYGNIALSTATLMPRAAPYQLALELCRGTLSRILTQFGDRLLEQPSIREALSEAKIEFIGAALHQADAERSAAHADRSLQICMEVIRETLCGGVRRSNSPPVFSSRLTGLQVTGPAQLGRLLGQREYPGNAIFYKSSWRDTEPNPGEWDWSKWQSALQRARAAKRRVACGPLVRLDREELPDWLYLWDDDFESLQSYLTTYVQQAVTRLRPLVHLWYVTAGTNIGAELHLGEEQRLRLTIAAMEELRKVDHQTPALIGIRQPWGDYLGHEPFDLSPIQFADILIRGDLGLTGFVLELNFACHPNRTMPRDMLEWNRLLEHWSSFGLPFVLTVTLPNGPSSVAEQVVTETFLRDLVDVVRQKPTVQGMIWGQFQDTGDWAAGAFTKAGRPKPIWQLLAELWCPTDTCDD
jgi:hypothetical protein